jgi:hypothetical protein
MVRPVVQKCGQALNFCAAAYKIYKRTVARGRKKVLGSHVIITNEAIYAFAFPVSKAKDPVLILYERPVSFLREST